jgi:hypothetical protein
MLKVWWVWCLREIVMEECVEGWMEGRSKKVYYMSESLSIVIIGAIVVLYCCDIASYCAIVLLWWVLSEKSHGEAGLEVKVKTQQPGTYAASWIYTD